MLEAVPGKTGRTEFQGGALETWSMVELRSHPQSKERDRISLHLRMRAPVAYPTYKLHIDAADGGIPIGCLLTSSSLHDSQAAIPLATQTGQRVTYLYELMDAAYDAKQIHEFSKSMGDVAIIDPNPRRDAVLKKALRQDAKAQRALKLNYRVSGCDGCGYAERTNSERVNARLKDDYGGRHVRVRGAAKVSCHLMFGILALTVEQLQRLLL